MKIQVVSFINSIPRQRKNQLVTELFNQSKASIILFPGWTFLELSDIHQFAKNITNINTVAICEVQNFRQKKIQNVLFSVEKGKLYLKSFQLFAQSNEINSNELLADIFLKEFEHNRKLKIKGKVVRLIQCGELNILKNEQSNKNKVSFRINNPLLSKKFKVLVDETDIFLNPIHSPMGNQGKMAKRRTFLSANNRAYFSTANVQNMHELLHYKSVQYGNFNGYPAEAIRLASEKEYILNEYNI